MKGSVKAAVAVVAATLLICILTGVWKYFAKPQTERIHHHQLAKGADPTLGMNDIPDNHLVGANFTSHLPLIIIDTGGQEIINYKYYDRETNSFREPEGIDPYVDINIRIINNDNHVNTLGDIPALVSAGRLKVRGNNSSSDNFPKKQYRIKLLTEEGGKHDLGVLGMEADDTWILNGTQRDRSYLRNYLAMSVGGTIIPYTPDMRFCELVLKRDDVYEYMGLYIMYETVKRGEGRVDIAANTAGDLTAYTYLLRRDRYDPESITLQTWATLGSIADPNLGINISDSCLELLYPNDENATPELIAAITQDISTLEQALYSRNQAAFDAYKTIIEIDSFVNYFLVNEFFLNYDAGEYSTYLYRDKGQKLSIGPIWDFDGAMDNHDGVLDTLEDTAMQSRPWFEMLITDDTFTRKLNDQYFTLRKTLFSEESITSFLDEAHAFLGNAILRDESRWRDEYLYQLAVIEEEETGLTIDRSATDSEGELERLKATIFIHMDAMDRIIPQFAMYHIARENIGFDSTLTILFLLCFFTAIILVQRARRS